MHSPHKKMVYFWVYFTGHMTRSVFASQQSGKSYYPLLVKKKKTDDHRDILVNHWKFHKIMNILLELKDTLG